MAAVDLDFDLGEDDAHAYLERAALGCESLIQVFPDREKLVSVLVFTTAVLLVSYRRHGTDWWDYLDQIDNVPETAASLLEEVVPTMLPLSRRKRALSKRAVARCRQKPSSRTAGGDSGWSWRLHLMGGSLDPNRAARKAELVGDRSVLLAGIWVDRPRLRDVRCYSSLLAASDRGISPRLGALPAHIRGRWSAKALV